MILLRREHLLGLQAVKELRKERWEGDKNGAITSSTSSVISHLVCVCVCLCMCGFGRSCAEPLSTDKQALWGRQSRREARLVLHFECANCRHGMGHWLQMLHCWWGQVEDNHLWGGASHLMSASSYASVYPYFAAVAVNTLRSCCRSNKQPWLRKAHQYRQAALWKDIKQQIVTAGNGEGMHQS